MKRILLDTDVTLDYIQQRSPFEVEANEIFDFLKEDAFIAYLAPITFVNVFYFARKTRGIVNAKAAVENLLKAVEVCKISKNILQNAVLSEISDYEDAVQHACAEAENLEAIVTRNLSDYKNATISVYSPTNFLNLLKTS